VIYQIYPDGLDILASESLSTEDNDDSECVSSLFDAVFSVAVLVHRQKTQTCLSFLFEKQELQDLHF
jgi:hypothetical protein